MVIFFDRDYIKKIVINKKIGENYYLGIKINKLIIYRMIIYIGNFKIIN